MAKIETYVATNAKVAVRKPNAIKCEWYTTTKETVFDAAEVVEVECPMGTRKAGAVVKVNRIVRNGHELYFPALIARTRLVLEDGDIDPAAFNQTYSCFQYDIPEKSDYPNPSGWLRHIAVRDQLSGWLIKKGAISTARQIAMMDAGCNVTIRDYAQYETAGIVADIVRSMYEEAARLAASINEREESADEYLRTAQAEGIDEKTARKNYETRIKSIERETVERVKAMSAAAKEFGFQNANSFINLKRIDGIVTTTKVAMSRKAAAYKQAAVALASTGDVDAVALANVMTDTTAPEMPVEAICDALIEQGKDKEAQELAQAHGTGVFGAVLEAPVAAPESDQVSAEPVDDVFDLV